MPQSFARLGGTLLHFQTTSPPGSRHNPRGTAQRPAAGHGLRGRSRKTTAAAFRNEPFPLKGNLFDLFLTPSLQLCLSYFPPDVFLLREQHLLLWSRRGVSGSARSHAPRHEHKCIATCSLLVKEPRSGSSCWNQTCRLVLNLLVRFQIPRLFRNDGHQPLSHRCVR